MALASSASCYRAASNAPASTQSNLLVSLLPSPARSSVIRPGLTSNTRPPTALIRPRPRPPAVLRRPAQAHRVSVAQETRHARPQSPADEVHQSLPQQADLSHHAYTSMRADPLSFWDNHQGLHILRRTTSTPAVDGGNIVSPSKAPKQADDDSLILTAELQLLRSAAADRAEMHAILAHQRDNWNKLFQRTLTATSMTACILSALAGQLAGNPMSLSLPALLLNAGGAAMMTVINQFQPSQLAEEQRTAARLFRKLASDVQYALSVPAHLRQPGPVLLRDCKRRLQALDKAFPMPLTPGGLEKFPDKVLPPVLMEPNIPPTTTINDDAMGPSQDGAAPVHDNTSNGWDEQLSHDLQQAASLLRASDIPKYTGWAQNLVTVNKWLAISAPLCALSAALLDALMMISTSSTLVPAPILGMWAATFSVLAAFVGSFSHDMQLGMVFELYRNSAGYYADTEASINETLAMPAQHREHGTLFYQRIAYQLGRCPNRNASTTRSLNGTTQHMAGNHLVPADAKEAGTLF